MFFFAVKAEVFPPLLVFLLLNHDEKRYRQQLGICFYGSVLLAFSFQKEEEETEQYWDSPKVISRDLFPGRFWIQEYHRISFHFSAVLLVSEELHTSLGNKTLSTACWILFWILNAILEERIVRLTDALTCICSWITVLKDKQNGSESVKNALCSVSVRLRRYRLLEAMKKNCLAFISSKSVSGFCFDSFYFITYLCLNEEKNTLFQLPKKFALHFIILFFIIYIYIYICFNSESYT